MTKLKKLILTLLASLILSVSVLPLFARPAHAQFWYDQTPQDWFVKVYDPDNPTEIFGERYTAAQVQWVVWGLFSLIIPPPIKPIVRCFILLDVTDCFPGIQALFAQAPADQDYYAQAEEKSLLAAVFEERSFSGITYTKDVIRKFHLIPEAKAQAGFGYEGLSIIQGLWQASRNIAYFFFVIAIIVMAFMIMFRVKISPQVVITVQSALPKIVVALVLITFSYAIAGFLVDLMYVAIGIISLLIANSEVGLSNSPTVIFGWLTQGEIISGVGILGIFGMFGLYMILFMFILFYVLLFGNGFIGAILEGIISVGAIPAMWASITVIVGFVLTILLIFISFKIVWVLLKAFTSVLLLTIVAPFQIAAGIFIPGVGFGAWVRNFLGNLAVFPLVGLLITLAFIFLLQAASQTTAELIPDVVQGFFNLPPDPVAIADGWPPLLGSGGVGGRVMGLVMIGVSIAILFLVPKSADIIKGLIQGRPFAYGTAIGSAIGPATWAWGIGPTREVREQASALGAYRAADLAIPQSWRRYEGIGSERRAANVWARLIERLEKRGGYG